MRAQEITRKDDNGAIAMLLMAIIKNAIDEETPNERRRLYKAIEEAVDFFPKKYVLFVTHSYKI